MIALSIPSVRPVTFNGVSLSCSGFNITDNTNYEQMDSDTSFGTSAFINGIRLIRTVAPSGVSTIHSFTNHINDDTHIISVDTSIDTRITIINNGSFKFPISSKINGVYLVHIVSIPNPRMGFASPTIYKTNDLAVFIQSSRYVIYQAIIDNPTNNPSNTGSWRKVSIDVNLKFSNLTGSEATIPSNYLNSVSVSQNCIGSNLSCIESKVGNSFCDSCKCGDICNNSKSMGMIKATLLMTRLEQLTIGTTQYNNTINQYKNTLCKLCQCS